MLPKTAIDKQRFEAKVAHLCKTMDSITKYSDLHFWEMSSNIAKTLQEYKKNFLLLVLKAIFRSTTVSKQVQLPLACRYNDANAVRQILESQGLLKLDKLQVRSYFLVFVPTIREIRYFYREM
eukprot:SAG31_NODE_9291_length_1303_cov_1.514120_1_plen_123_part_00